MKLKEQVCTEIKVVLLGVRPRGWTKRTWKEVVEGDMKSLKLSKEDSLAHSKWRRLIRGTEEDSEMIAGVNVSDCFWYQLTHVILD